MFQFQLCERGEWGRFPEGRLYERKLDGTRALAIKLEDKVKLINRRGFEYTEQFPEIVADLRRYPHHALILDGEICDRDFSTLAGRTHLQDRFKIEMRAKLHPCTFWVFDVLQVGVSKLSDQPLYARKQVLEELGDCGQVKILKPEPLETLLAEVEAKRIEGIIAKDPSSRYEFSRSRAWLKFRKEEAEDLLIIGFEDTDKKPTRPFRSLIFRRGEREVQASSGLSEADLRLLDEIFAKEPKRRVGTKWYFEKPRFVAEVKFFGGSEIPYRFPRVVRLKLENPKVISG